MMQPTATMRAAIRYVNRDADRPWFSVGPWLVNAYFIARHSPTLGMTINPDGPPTGIGERAKFLSSLTTRHGQPAMIAAEPTFTSGKYRGHPIVGWTTRGHPRGYLRAHVLAAPLLAMLDRDLGVDHFRTYEHVSKPGRFITPVVLGFRGGVLMGVTSPLAVPINDPEKGGPPATRYITRRERETMTIEEATRLLKRALPYVAEAEHGTQKEADQIAAEIKAYLKPAKPVTSPQADKAARRKPAPTPRPKSEDTKQPMSKQQAQAEAAAEVGKKGGRKA